MSLMINKDIAAIVVTFNKKNLLVNAIQGVLNQELLPNLLIIIDNNSTDGTYELLVAKGWIKPIEKSKNNINIISSNEYLINESNITIRYIKKHENDGGAGGFYEGMKQAYDLGYEWVWLMDDDGVPEKTCLKYLYDYKSKTAITGPLVIDIETSKTASFLFDDNGSLTKVEELTKKAVIENQLTPFNGTFIYRGIIQRIGFVKKEMFIWGDEYEYQLRALSNNFTIKTITKAIHKHPINKKNPIYESKLFNFIIYEISNPVFMFIYFRNYIYLYKKYRIKRVLGINLTLIRFIYVLLLNFVYNLFKGNFKKSLLLLKSIKYGFNENFSLDKIRAN